MSAANFWLAALNSILSEKQEAFILHVWATVKLMS